MNFRCLWFIANLFLFFPLKLATEMGKEVKIRKTAVWETKWKVQIMGSLCNYTEKKAEKPTKMVIYRNITGGNIVY